MVEASNGRTLTKKDAEALWEEGDFSEWAETNGFPLIIDGEEFEDWTGVEDALASL